VVLLNNNTAVGSFKFHIGANAETTSMVGANEVSLYSSTLNATASGLSITTVSVSTQSSSNAIISALDAAVETVSTQRGLMGAMQNRLEHSIESLGVASENAGAANSRIRDADVAKAVSEMVRTQILQQSTMAVLAQANQAPQMALQLLK
jgi:flagellin